MHDRTFKTEKGAIRHAAEVARLRPGRVWVVRREFLGNEIFKVTDCWSDNWTRAEVVWTNTGE